MYFGLNTLQYSHVIRFTDRLEVVFKCGKRFIPLTIDQHTSKEFISSLLEALDLPSDSTKLKDLAYALFSIPSGTDILVFLHYHDTLGHKDYTFLHIPGTLEQGHVFDKVTDDNYLAFTTKTGDLVYADPATKNRSRIARSAKYMESAHVKEQGIKIIFNAQKRDHV
ncbi:MAG: hypothetical protein H6546_02685 [Chitinophagales bacterium]|nr:hypothetical protein [Chitinophagales bacterium]